MTEQEPPINRDSVYFSLVKSEVIQVLMVSRVRDEALTHHPMAGSLRSQGLPIACSYSHVPAYRERRGLERGILFSSKTHLSTCTYASASAM